MAPGQILAEPTRRNTAPCIAWAAYHIRSIDPNANIVVTPADHLILKMDEFMDAMNAGFEFVSNHDRLLCVGIRTTRPETRYGYIQIGDESEGEFHSVKTFTEKPEIELARIFMESGEFFWNSGLFAWNVNTIVDAFEKFLPDVASRFELGKDYFNTPKEREFIQENFPYCLNISIDYGIMEKADNVYMLCVDFGWADLGTWGSLFDLAPKDECNNSPLKTKTPMYESTRNIVSLDNPDRLAVIQGLQDCIVAESGNVLLLCKKDEAQRIKQFVPDAQIKFGKAFN